MKPLPYIDIKLAACLTCWNCLYNFRLPIFHSVAAWLTGSALVSIDEVTLRRARLVLGWVTVCGRVNHLGLLPATQALSLLPSAGLKISTGQSAVMLCGWGVKAGMVYSTCG